MQKSLNITAILILILNECKNDHSPSFLMDVRSRDLGKKV